MTRRETIKRIIAGGGNGETGFWLGQPVEDTWPLLHEYFGTKTEEELRQKLNDDCRWICPQFYADVYQAPDGSEMFDSGLDRERHAKPPLADCENADEAAAFAYPNPDYLNFDSCLEDLRNAGDVYRMSGFWTCFYHNLMDLFGMEEYLIKMFTAPEVVHVVTDKVCEFYYEANARFFEAAGDLMDGFFFGNDFGTQQSLICSPEQFDEFIMPWLRKFTEQGHQAGYQAILHSCGAVHDVIDRLIDAEVDCLHPIQALARNMDAETLARDFGGRIRFMGGIDAQNLMTNASPEEIKKDVLRVRNILESQGLIVSPSHEAILPNVPPENVEALADSVK